MGQQIQLRINNDLARSIIFSTAKVVLAQHKENKLRNNNATKNKFARAGITAAAALSLVLGTAVVATATTSEQSYVGITPFRNGWVDCTGRGRPRTSGVLAVQGWMRLYAGADAGDIEGPRGTGGSVHNFTETRVMWRAIGSAGEAWGDCD